MFRPVLLSVRVIVQSHVPVISLSETSTQDGLTTTDNPHRQSGQAIIKEFLDYTDDINASRTWFRIIIVWIPGRTEIHGIERADTEANKAA